MPGKPAFRADVSEGGADIWSEGSGSLTLVARKGRPAPGTPSNFGFASLNSQLVLNEVGQTAFVNNTDPRSDGSGNLALLAAHSSFVHVLNNVGQTAFQIGGGAGGSIWSEGSGSLVQLTSLGQPDWYWGAVGSLSLNDAGHCIFWGSLTESCGPPHANWSNRSGNLALIARTGVQAPRTPSGVTYNRLGFPGLNSAGQTQTLPPRQPPRTPPRCVRSPSGASKRRARRAV
jgi:hypothetical protein